MRTFLDKDFLLLTDTAKELYHQHAAQMPIIDYHCHLDPRQIAENKSFKDLTEIWLGGDHYKWRAMRANGIPETYITGDAPSYEKFLRWAETVPYTMRNPLYHWTHLELSRIFGIDRVLNSKTAEEIYKECTEKLHTTDFLPQSIMRRMNVEIVCTTDDPVDTLEYHRQLRTSECHTKVFPAWRPDKVLAIQDTKAINDYLEKLEAAADQSILSYKDLLDALRKRHDFFVSQGCQVSDHGLDTFYAEPYTDREIEDVFLKGRMGKAITEQEIRKYRSALLYELAVMDAESDWVQQFHIGANRNNNSRMFRSLGPDAGFDAIDDQPIAVSMNRFFNRLEEAGELTRTIVYNLNPRDNELMVANAYNFNDGSVAGKMQYGAAWWFLDQIRGMENQLDTLSSLGLLSRFVGMLTDSRSFLSYPRHEYFRRILCNKLGDEVENGLLPSSELPFIGQMIEDISYNNAKRYFKW